jgi:beta-phosphoglucomutase-like phosphatase (HAD superfamily)
MAIRGFLFDLDGTLVDSERETAEAMARALERGQGIALATSPVGTSRAHRVIDTLDELTPALVGELDAHYGVAMGAP